MLVAGTPETAGSACSHILGGASTVLRPVSAWQSLVAKSLPALGTFSRPKFGCLRRLPALDPAGRPICVSARSTATALTDGARHQRSAGPAGRDNST